MINEVLGIQFKIVLGLFDLYAKNEGDLVGCSASNNGYEKSLGVLIKEKYT